MSRVIELQMCTSSVIIVVVKFQVANFELRQGSKIEHSRRLRENFTNEAWAQKTQLEIRNIYCHTTYTYKNKGMPFGPTADVL